MKFICPKCRRPLVREGGALRCKKGHSYDIASQGYVNLVLSGRSRSPLPGDNPQMTAARTQFLESGAYAPLAEAVAETLRGVCPEGGAVLDAGCGEGDYVRRLYALLAPIRPEIYGVDLSRGGIRHAARACAAYTGEDVRFAVASVYTLPLPDASMDAVVNVFSPLAPAEITRVLCGGGCLIAALPGARHLFEMKEVLYERPYENDETLRLLEGLRLLRTQRVTYPMALEGERVRNLYRMTPYSYKTSPEGAARLEALERLTVTADFLLCVYGKE